MIQESRTTGTAILVSVFLFALLGFGNACASHSNPDSSMSNPSNASADPFAAHRRGKKLFESRCVACHALYKPAAYTVDEWRELVPDMAYEARMTRSQTKAVLDYVLAAKALEK